VIRGRSEVEVSFLTGESRPVGVAEGERVYAGTVNRSAPLEVRVEEAGESSRLGHILREVEAASQRRAPVVQLADRLAGAFVLVVLGLAVATFAIWLRREPAVALDNAIALLIVTCPCALALATPLAITVAVGRAARMGILVKGGDALERLGRPGVLYLDKTGTVTEGRTVLLEWEGPAWVKPLVLALERRSGHPVAAGFLEAWPGFEAGEAAAVEHVAGGGVSGTVAGRRVVVGTLAHVRARSGRDLAWEGRAPDAALTPVFVAVDDALVARAGFGDRIRADSPAALARLRARGWKLRLLSGDDPAVVAEVGARLGFAPEECRGGATPEEKRRVIEESARDRPTVMVGDGINDAAAIAGATVGVGVRGGAEACLASADVFLARPGLAALVSLIEGAERCLGLIHRTLAFSLAYNLAGATLAVTGVIHPLIAAILMPLSSLTVVLLSWRGRTFEEARP
jgi:Cu2+-exporting ATPase